MAKKYDFLVVGGGIFGISAAIELARRKHSVGLINPDSIPHHLAASTDISKAVRMEYGPDREYAEMAEISIRRWREWNAFFSDTLYHETGFLMLCRKPLKSVDQQYELKSIETVGEMGYAHEHLDKQQLKARYPVVHTECFPEAAFNPVGGFAESSRIIEKLATYAASIGVKIHEGQTAEFLGITHGRLESIRTREGHQFTFGHAIIAAGAHTPELIPDLKPYIRATGHPVFWVRPADTVPFMSGNFPVFTADIAHTGWYGFPALPSSGVVKFGKHAQGLTLHPERDERRVTDSEVADFRSFLKESFPVLANAPVVYTRRCLYTDTLDGHFWIDRHPDIGNLTISTGGSGHGFKMGPVIGEMTADVAEGGKHNFSDRYSWRHLEANGSTADAARHMQ